MSKPYDHKSKPCKVWVLVNRETGELILWSKTNFEKPTAYDAGKYRPAIVEIKEVEG